VLIIINEDMEERTQRKLKTRYNFFKLLKTEGSLALTGENWFDHDATVGNGKLRVTTIPP